MTDMVERIADLLVSDHIEILVENQRLVERNLRYRAALVAITTIPPGSARLRRAVELAEQALSNVDEGEL